MNLFRSLALASLFVSSVVLTSRAQFADAVVDYVPGSGAAASFTNHPTVALGAPSQLLPAFDFVDPTHLFDPVDPFDPPYLTNQIVSIGAGGSLTLRFDTPIVDNTTNLFGRDFTVFGNSGFIITNDMDFDTFEWIGTPATDGSLFGQNDGATRVWVSADGTNFFLLNTNLTPTVDGLFPPDSAGFPATPVDPALTADDFAGQTYAGIAALYHGSGGCTSYDIAWAEDTNGAPVALSSVSYVRIEVVSGASEIDAVSRVALPPAISTQPITQTVSAAGSNATFTVAATSAVPLTYQWYCNGLALAGQTNATLTLPNAVVTANAGGYSVIVSSAAGSVTSSAATLNLPVPSGIYSGLFFETNSVQHDSSGFFTFTVAKSRAFNGKLLIDGASHKLTGLFPSNHHASVVIVRTNGNLTVDLQLLNEADEVTGTVGNGVWSAPLAGDRAVYNLTNNPAPQTGQYTFTLFTDSNGDDAPSNGSLGIATVKSNGVITVKGPLADQSPMTQSTYISKDGKWPFYVPLYKGGGSLLGWLSFTNEPTLKLKGDVSWIKTKPFGLYYSQGFTNTLAVYGGSRKP